MPTQTAGVRIVLEGCAPEVERKLDVERLPRNGREPRPASIVATVGGVISNVATVDDGIHRRVFLEADGALTS